MKGIVQSVILSKDVYKNKRQANKQIRDMGFKVKYKNKEVDEKENSYRYRQEDPNNFKKFRTKVVNEGISLVLGYK